MAGFIEAENSISRSSGQAGQVLLAGPNLPLQSFFFSQTMLNPDQREPGNERSSQAVKSNFNTIVNGVTISILQESSHA